MPWVIAIMVALTVIAAVTGLALRNIALAAAADLSDGVTVQVLDSGGEGHQVEHALAALKDAPGVASVRQVPAQEIDRLLAPGWAAARSRA
jgi:cell division transport system permease protein